VLLYLRVRLGERHHCTYGIQIGLMDLDRTAQVTFVLGGFLGQNVALERLTTLDGTAGTNAKTLLRAALGFHLWHAHIHPIPGGSFIGR